ncbi:unnamed protein product [Sphagnum troendelagicum]|uniref:Uncharacterized protein n=1 Tax=Sphagnum troendelagicum TaxID=128251 RepID=A0ABP0U0Q2_9BRYO
MDNIAQFRPALRFTFAPRASSLSSSTQGGFPIQNNNSHVNFSSPGCNKNFAPRINSCCGNYPPIKNFAADCNLQYPRQLLQQHHINIRSKLLFASQLPSFRYVSKSSSMLMAPPPMSQHLEKTGSLVWTSLESPTGKKGGGSLATVCACKNACTANETLRWIFVGASLYVHLRLLKSQLL